MRPFRIEKAEVTHRLWEDVLDLAKEAGCETRGCTGYVLTVIDVEPQDPPGPEAVELLEEDHCGSD